MAYVPPNPNGSTTAANSSPVTVATDNNIAKETGGNLATIATNTPALGQALAAASTPVVLTAAQLSTLATETTLASAIKAEDAGHSSGDKGIPALAVRNDTGAVLATSDLDYIPIATDATGAVRVDLNGTVSTNNSSTATLLSGAVFTGTSDDSLNYNEIRVTVIASHASATDGLSIQQSSDNTNWDSTDTYTIPATTGKTYSVPRQARYIRVVYTNGGTNQSSFRLQTILNRLGTKASSQRAGDAYTNETDLEQQQSFLMGFNGTTWDRIRTVGTGVLSASAVLTAGSAIVGKVGIDQTTPGTTNLVALTAETTKVLGVTRTADGAGNLITSTGNALDVNLKTSAATNISTNLAQVNGVTTLTGTGATGTGTQRVTVAVDSATVAGSASLPAGTNAIGKLSANSGVIIGDINVISEIPGTGATNLGKAEDAVHGSGDTGVMDLGVINTNLTTTFAASGDYAPKALDVKGRTLVAQKAATGTLSNVASSATSVTVLAANAERIGATITNDSSALLYLKFGATASTTSYTVVLAGAASAPFSYYEVPAGYTGIIDGIWASATGNARVTEIA